MSRRLILLNVLLVGVSLVLLAYIARQVLPRAAGLSARPHTAATSMVTSPSATPKQPPPPGPYSVVASRNLFSPTRTETAAATGSAPLAPKHNLYGVVVRDGAPIAYLEDPATKRVAGYRTGDTVAGGTVQLITADHVVLGRPEGPVELRLNDPAKPRPQALPPPPVPSQIAPPPGSVPQTGMPRFQEGRRPREE
jgi:hypothetical protein